MQHEHADIFSAALRDKHGALGIREIFEQALRSDADGPPRAKLDQVRRASVRLGVAAQRPDVQFIHPVEHDGKKRGRQL